VPGKLEVDTLIHSDDETGGGPELWPHSPRREVSPPAACTRASRSGSTISPPAPRTVRLVCEPLCERPGTFLKQERPRPKTSSDQREHVRPKPGFSRRQDRAPSWKSTTLRREGFWQLGPPRITSTPESFPARSDGFEVRESTHASGGQPEKFSLVGRATSPRSLFQSEKSILRTRRP